MPQRPPNRVNTQSPNRPAIRPSLGKPAPQNEIANDLKNFSINQPASPSQQSQRTVVIGGSSGGSSPAPSSVALSGDVTGPSSANTISSIMSVPLVGNLINGQAWYQSGGVLVPVTLTFGTVTNFMSGALSPIFTTSVATASTTPALTFTLSNAAANTALMGPTSGGAAAPAYRTFVAADIPNLDASIITSGTMATARLGSGTANNTTFLRGDQTWATPPSGFTNPMTTLGDIIYEDATPTAVRLAGNTTTTKKFLRQTGTGSASASPAWDTLVAGDIPNLDASKITTGQLALARGGTNADLSSTGGAGQYLKQSGSGSAVTVSAIAAADVPVFVASGASHAPGAVPDPGSSAGTTRFLREDATFAVPPGSSTATNAIQPLVKTAATLTSTTSLWRMDNGSGTTVTDRVGSNNLTLQNSTAWQWGTDAFGTYLMNSAGSLNGYLSSGNAAGLTSGDIFLEVLFMPGTIQGVASSSIVPIGVGTSSAIGGTRVLMIGSQTNSSGFTGGIVNGSPYGIVYNTVPVSFIGRSVNWLIPGQMAHMIVTFQQSTGAMNLIWNGVIVSAATMTGTRGTIGGFYINVDPSTAQYYTYCQIYLASAGNHFVTASEALTRYTALMA